MSFLSARAAGLRPASPHRLPSADEGEEFGVGRLLQLDELPYPH